MTQSGRLRRKPTATAVLVGVLCLLLSLGVVGGIGFLVLFWLRQVSPTLGVVLIWAGPLPLVIVVGWSTLLLMDLFEKTTGLSLRTRSVRKSR